MEEDNRSYHLSHPFRQYQYRRISEAKTIDAIKFGGSETRQSITIPWGSYRTKAIRFSSGSLASSLVFLPIKTRPSAATVTSNRVVTSDQKQPILGMTAVEDDEKHDESEDCTRYLDSIHNKNKPKDSKSCSKNTVVSDNGNVEERYGQLQQQDHQDLRQSPPENPSWLDETQRLFQDYERRFHRQSLTEQAKWLLDRAFQLARAGGCGNKTSKSHNQDDAGKMDCETTNYETTTKNTTDFRASIILCTEALTLCRTAIEDQEEALRRNDVIGGSYLVTGDIRLRRKGEALEAKIYCLRAALFYQEGLYGESLEDCEAAISIWNQQYGGEQQPSARAAMGRHRFGIGSNNNKNKAIASSSHSNKASPPLSPRTRNRKKLSHKHLYLLKGRVLAAMGRYRDAVEWLTHPHQLPAKIFQRSSALLETDAAMNRFLDQLLVHNRGNNINRAKRVGGMPKTQDSSCPSPVASRINTKLWSNLLYRVDKRLNEGMVGRFNAKSASGSEDDEEGTTSSKNPSKHNSGSAIYHLLRHGPVLFHHYHQGDEKVDEKASSPKPPGSATGKES